MQGATSLADRAKEISAIVQRIDFPEDYEDYEVVLGMPTEDDGSKLNEDFHRILSNGTDMDEGNEENDPE